MNLQVGSRVYGVGTGKRHFGVQEFRASWVLGFRFYRVQDGKRVEAQCLLGDFAVYFILAIESGPQNLLNTEQASMKSLADAAAIRSGRANHRQRGVLLGEERGPALSSSRIEGLVRFRGYRV